MDVKQSIEAVANSSQASGPSSGDKNHDERERLSLEKFGHTAPEANLNDDKEVQNLREFRPVFVLDLVPDKSLADLSPQVTATPSQLTRLSHAEAEWNPNGSSKGVSNAMPSILKLLPDDFSLKQTVEIAISGKALH